MSRHQRWVFFVLGLTVAMAVGALAVYRPVAGVAVVVASIALIGAVRMGPGGWTSLLLVAGGLVSRPSVGGDSFGPVGLGLAVAAAMVAIRTDRGRRLVRYGLPLMVTWLLVAYGWLAIHDLWLSDSGSAASLPAGIVLTVGGAAAAAAVLRDPGRAQLVGRLTVYLLAAVASSYVMTVVIWLIGGEGTGQLETLSLGSAKLEGSLYFPFTATLGSVEVAGQDLPRLTGVGREPGIMGLYFMVGFFLTKLVNVRSRIISALLLAGLLATWSTGALAVFLPVWAYDRLWKNARPISRLVALPAIAAAGWAAFNAPVLGIKEKLTSDPYSVGDRQIATEAGWRALLESPLAGADALMTEVPAVNFVASIAAYGVPFALACSLAIWLPRKVRPAGTTVALAVFLTLLTTQPARDSLWVFVLVMLGYAASPPRLGQEDAPGLAVRQWRWLRLTGRRRDTKADPAR